MRKCLYIFSNWIPLCNKVIRQRSISVVALIHTKKKENKRKNEQKIQEIKKEKEIQRTFSGEN